MLYVSALMLLCVTAGHDVHDDAQSDKLICGHAHSAALRLQRAANGEQRPIYDRANNDTDVLHYDLELEIDPDTQWIGGSNTITTRSLIDGLTTFQVRIDELFTLTAVESGGVSASWNRLDSATIEITLDQTYNTNDEFDVFIEYDGNPQSLGFGSINFGWESGYPHVFTLSETWYAYTWWPTKDDNRDKATAEFSFIVPDELTIASNGVLVNQINLGNGKIQFDWETNYPTATYLFCFGLARYNTFSETFNYDTNSMPVDFYIFPNSDTPEHRDDWRKCVDMLGVFSDLFGIYPFVDEKYGMYEFAFGGGMEHQTMTGQGSFSDWVTAHEAGHQWWGDMVTCASWNDIWLNEGFARYSEALWFENEPGGGGEQALHNRMAQVRPSSVNDSVYVYDAENQSLWRIFSTTFTYNKGGWVVHQLRHVVGDDTFFDILAAYRQAYEFGSAVTDDLVAVASSVYGSDLTWFFDEWVYDIGAPAYRYGWQSIQVNGEHYLEIYLDQTQSTSFPIFIMPLDIEYVVNGQDEMQVIWNDEETEHFLLPVDNVASGVELDPDDWVLITSKQNTSFVAGPPKIVAIDPAPGSSTAETDGQTVQITFHQDVSTSAGDYSLAGDSSGAVAFAFSYDQPTQTVTLTPSSDLEADEYTLTVSDAVVAQSTAIALDGELANPADPGSLPSGEGLPGGDAVAQFTITNPADITGDGVVNIDDIFAVLGLWGDCPDPCPPYCTGDLTEDCTVNIDDIFAILGQWG